MKDSTIRSLLKSIFQISNTEANYIIQLCKDHRKINEIPIAKYDEIIEAISAYKVFFLQFDLIGIGY
jgi:hypothetical protein